MSAFIDEVSRLVDLQCSDPLVKSLEVFHNAAIEQAVKEERERIKDSLHIVIAEGTGSNDPVYVSLIHGIIGKYFATLEADHE